MKHKKQICLKGEALQANLKRRKRQKRLRQEQVCDTLIHSLYTHHKEQEKSTTSQNDALKKALKTHH